MASKVPNECETLIQPSNSSAVIIPSESGTETDPEWMKKMESFKTNDKKPGEQNFELVYHLAQSCSTLHLHLGCYADRVSIRVLVSLRIVEACSPPASKRVERRKPLLENIKLTPIPAQALDGQLSPVQAEILQKFLPDGYAYRTLYHGLSIQTCTQCHHAKIQVDRNTVHSFFRGLAEYPVQELQERPSSSMSRMCSSCHFNKLLRGISRDWWYRINSSKWLKFDMGESPQSTCFLDGLELYRVLYCKLLSCDEVDRMECLNQYVFLQHW